MGRYYHFADEECSSILEYREYLTILMDDVLRESLHSDLQTDDFCSFLDYYLFEDPEFIFYVEEVSSK